MIRLTQTRSLKEAILHRERPKNRELWALRDVDIDVHPGEAFGIVGPNGSGKSTLLKLLAGIFAPSTGELQVGGRVGSLIEIGAGFHPEFTGVENVYLNAAIYGLKRSYVDAHVDEIIDFAGSRPFRDVPVRTYSSGMYMRLGFSVAMHVQPDVLLLDEVFAVGDEAFQQKCYGEDLGVQAKRRHDRVRLARPRSRSRTCASERSCSSTVVASSRGRPARWVRAYHRRLVSASATERGAATTGTVPAATACTRCGRLPGTAPSASASRKASRWPSRSGSTPTTGLKTGALRLGSATRAGGARLPENRRGSGCARRRSSGSILHFPGLPMREGRFFVDVVVGTQDGDAELAFAERALELSAFSQDTRGGGPVRLGGTRELPADDGPGHDALGLLSHRRPGLGSGRRWTLCREVADEIVIAADEKDRFRRRGDLRGRVGPFGLSSRSSNLTWPGPHAQCSGDWIWRLDGDEQVEPGARRGAAGADRGTRGSGSTGCRGAGSTRAGTAGSTSCRGRPITTTDWSGTTLGAAVHRRPPQRSRAGVPRALPV